MDDNTVNAASRSYWTPNADRLHQNPLPLPSASASANVSELVDRFADVDINPRPPLSHNSSRKWIERYQRLSTWETSHQSQPNMPHQNAPRGQRPYDQQRNQGQGYYEQQYDRRRQYPDQQRNRGDYYDQQRNREYHDLRRTHPLLDSYRPNTRLPPASDFSYRSRQQLPRAPAWAPPASNRNRPIKRATGAGHGKNATSARPLLQENSNRDSTPEPSPSLANMTQRFKLQEGSDINDFTQVRNPNSSQDASQPATQAMSNEQGEFAVSNMTKNPRMSSTSWSNPDPYASLPGASDQKPTKDFVQFIRNARINQETELTQLSNASNFISL